MKNILTLLLATATTSYLDMARADLPYKLEPECDFGLDDDDDEDQFEGICQRYQEDIFYEMDKIDDLDKQVTWNEYWTWWVARLKDSGWSQMKINKKKKYFEKAFYESAGDDKVVTWDEMFAWLEAYAKDETCEDPPNCDDDEEEEEDE